MRLISSLELALISGGAEPMPTTNPDGLEGIWELQGEQWVFIQRITVRGHKLDSVDRLWASVYQMTDDCKLGAGAGAGIGGVVGTFVLPALGTGMGAAAGLAIGCTVGVGVGIIGDIFDLRSPDKGTQKP